MVRPGDRSMVTSALSGLAATLAAVAIMPGSSAAQIAAPSTIEEKPAAPHGRPGIEPSTPEAWASRIEKMREAGHTDAADRELAALQRRYPRFEIPRRAIRERRDP